MKGLSLLLLLLPSLAQAAPFDLAELRARWPGHPYVVLSQTHDVDIVEGTLRVRSERRIAILTDAAREELGLFEITHRPGCSEVSDLQIVTTGRDGAEQRITGDELAHVPLAEGTDPDRIPVLMKGPRRGIAPGALVAETQRVDHPPGCFGGLLSTELRLGDPLGPVEEEEVRVHCAGAGCSAALDREEGTWSTVEGATVLRREGVEPLPPETHHPREDRPRLFVSSSADPLAAARTLAPLLAAARGPASRVVGTYVSAAKKAQAAEPDAAARIGRYFAALPVRGGDPFWESGFAIPAPPKDGDRLIGVMEWWALATAALAPHGGVPMLFDSTSHLAPPTVGDVTAWDRVGVLVPGRFALVGDEFVALTGDTATDLAGRNAILLEAEPRPLRFAADPAVNHQRWTGTVELTIGDYLKYDLAAAMEGSTAASLHEGYTAAMTSWKDADRKRRATPAERDRAFVGGRVFERDISVGSVAIDGKRLDAVTVQAIFSRGAEVQRGEGVVSLVLPLPLDPQLEGVVTPGERVRAIALNPVDIAIDLLVRTPEGHRLAGLPAPRAITDGPVTLDWSWTEDPEGARLHLAYRIEDAVLDPSAAPAVHAAAELLRRALDGCVLYVTSPASGT
jgi:hypothetical protein